MVYIFLKIVVSIKYQVEQEESLLTPTEIKSSVVATTYHKDKWLHRTVNLLILNLEWEVHKRTWQEVSA